MHGKQTIILSLIVLFSFTLTLKAHKPAYLLYRGDGEQVTFTELAEAAREVHVVLFGELHNNPISHWLQLELSRELVRSLGQDLVMGAEMFEADDQILLDEYFSGRIMERHFRAEAKLWGNYDTDIRPLVELARENGLPFVATNIPRRYAALVHREGFEALEGLGQQAKNYIAPLPVPYDPELPAYKAMLEMGLPAAHGGENLPKAQAIKDATMAHFIMENLPGAGVFIHFHGTYHSNHYEGIAWYLDTYSEETVQMLTIATAEAEEIGSLPEDQLGVADFIILVPATMTKTH